MRLNRKGLRAAALTFLFCLTLHSAFKSSTRCPARTATDDPLRLIPPTSDVASLTDASPCGVEDMDVWGNTPTGQVYKNLYNGVKLPLDYDALSRCEVAEAKILPLASERILAGAGRTLYMLETPGRVVWRHTEPQPLIDFAHVAKTGMVYVTAGDNNMFILDSSTGRELHRDARNGRAGFGAVAAFGEDLCLVVDDNSGYRSQEDYAPPMSDGVSAWRGTKMLWYRPLPPDAELRVVGDRILAVTKTSNRVLIQPVLPPETKG